MNFLLFIVVMSVEVGFEILINYSKSVKFDSGQRILDSPMRM